MGLKKRDAGSLDYSSCLEITDPVNLMGTFANWLGPLDACLYGDCNGGLPNCCFRVWFPFWP